MEAALVWVVVVLVSVSCLVMVVAFLTKPFRKGKPEELPEEITLTVQGREIAIPVPSADKLTAWDERRRLNEANPQSCEAAPGAGEVLVPVSFVAPGSGLAGWSKSEQYWEAANRASWNGYNNIAMPEADYKEAKEYIAEAKRREALLYTTAELNNKGIELEKAGEVEAAVSVYEECIKLRYPANHAYYRLMVLYRKAKDAANEERVIRIALEVFPNETKYADRLTRLLARNVTK